MLRYAVVVFVLGCLAAWYGPDAVTALTGVRTGGDGTAVSVDERPVARKRAGPATAAQVARGNTVRLARGRGGHYHADVYINGRRLEMLVDTGASLIALTARDARRMGVYPPSDQFVYETQTANGIARVALVELDEVKIGHIRLKNVKATVHKGRGLSTNLLGMSFLNRLRKFNFENDTLTLVN